MKLYVTRHGETELNASGRVSGLDDVPLTGRGRAQAEALARAAQGKWIDLVITSPLRRARETAEIVARALGVPAVSASGLTELALGGLDGRYIEEVRKTEPEAYERRGRTLLTYKYDADSENFYDLRYRAIKQIQQIVQQDAAPDLLAVTHAGVIRVLAAEIRGESLERAVRAAPPPHGSIVTLTEKNVYWPEENA